MLRELAIGAVLSLVCVAMVASAPSYSGTLFITTYDLDHDVGYHFNHSIPFDLCLSNEYVIIWGMMC
jgi:hypothetical protein